MVFKKKKVATKQKLRGGYYTPAPIADFLTDWALSKGSRQILEPSCGDGVFIKSCVKWLSRRRRKVKITAVELDGEELEKARLQSASRPQNVAIEWLNQDFFKSYSNQVRAETYDTVLGNPPFIRFQHFDGESREIAFQHLREAGYKPTKLANAWAGFVQLSIESLKAGGNLAMVLPAELMQVKYSAELRNRIIESFERVVLVSFRKLVFPSIQQEVVILLAEGKRDHLGQGCDIHTIDIHDERELTISSLNNAITHKKARHSKPGIKWTSLYLPEKAFNKFIDFQSDLRIPRLGDLASIDVGIVTGRNDFFVVSNETVSEYRLSQYTVPVVGRTSAISNIVFGKNELDEFQNQNRGNLLSLSKIPKDQFSEDLHGYLNLGEKDEVHKGYKCRIRQRWFDVPSVYVSDGFLFRQIHRYPLMVANKTDAVCTDTIHRFVMHNGDAPSQVSCSFVNSLTFAASELYGRSYGGGVLELEPGEAERLPIPYSAKVELDEEYIRNELKERRVENALDYVDQTLLIEHFGYSLKDVSTLRKSWQTLSGRRLSRKSN